MPDLRTPSGRSHFFRNVMTAMLLGLSRKIEWKRSVDNSIIVLHA